MWREQSARKEVEHERNNKGKQRTKNKTKTGKNQKSFPVKVLSSWLKESFSLKKKNGNNFQIWVDLFCFLVKIASVFNLAFSFSLAPIETILL